MRAVAAVAAVAALAGALAVSACRGGTAAPAPDAGPPAAPAEILLDDAVVGSVRGAELTAPRALASLLPHGIGAPATWREIQVFTADGRVLYVRRPGERHVGQEARLDRGARGGVRFGMYAAAATPVLALDDVVKIEVRIAEPAEEVVLPGGFVVVDGVTRTEHTAASLEARATVPSPEPGNRNSRGWDLGALLAEGGAVRRVELVGRDGKALTLEAAAFARGERLLLLRFNRRGQARLRVWTLGAAPRVESEIEDLTQVTVLR